MIDWLIFLISLNSKQEQDHSGQQRVWVYQVVQLLIDWFDLPNLTTFTTGYQSFYKTRSLSINSMIDIWLIDLIFLISLHSKHVSIHSAQQEVWIYRVDRLIIDWLDLPGNIKCKINSIVPHSHCRLWKSLFGFCFAVFIILLSMWLFFIQQKKN